MNNIIFAKTRHEYAPYRDFFDVAALSGFKVAYLDEIDWRNPDLNVIATPKNAEWEAIPRDHACKLIHWQLERGHEDVPLMDMSHPHKPDYVDEVWASDKAFADKIGARYVFMGGHRAFGNFNLISRPYDYVTLMAPLPRRMPLFKQLHSLGLRGADQEGGTWGPQREQALTRSKLLISCHQDELPWSEPLRFMIAACYALPIVSETCEHPGDYVANVHYVSDALGDLPSLVRIMLSQETLRLRLAAAAWRLVCVEMPFEKCVMEAVYPLLTVTL